MGILSLPSINQGISFFAKLFLLSNLNHFQEQPLICIVGFLSCANVLCRTEIWTNASAASSCRAVEVPQRITGCLPEGGCLLLVGTERTCHHPRTTWNWQDHHCGWDNTTSCAARPESEWISIYVEISCLSFRQRDGPSGHILCLWPGGLMAL